MHTHLVLPVTRNNNIIDLLVTGQASKVSEAWVVERSVVERSLYIESEIARRIWLKLGRRVEGMQEIIRMRDFFIHQR